MANWGQTKEQKKPSVEQSDCNNKITYKPIFRSFNIYQELLMSEIGLLPTLDLDPILRIFRCIVTIFLKGGFCSEMETKTIPVMVFEW